MLNFNLAVGRVNELMDSVKKGFGITHAIFIPISTFEIKLACSKEASRKDSKMILLALA